MAQDDTVQRENKGTFVPLIFGGAVATALGFFGGQLEPVEQALGLSEPDAGLEQLVQSQADQIAQQSEMIAALTEKVDAIPAPDLSGIESTIAGVESLVTEQGASVSAHSEMLGTFATRLETVEKRPMTEGLSDEAVAAYEAELARLQAAASDQGAALVAEAEAQRSEIAKLVEDAQAREAEQRDAIGAEAESMRAEIAALIEEANTREAALQATLAAAVAAQKQEISALTEDVKTREAAAAEQAKVAAARAAMAKIITAVDTGDPFADALSELEQSGGADVPEALVATAEEGVPTLASLQGEFPSVARAALSTARSETAAEEGGGIGSFLQRSLGARSVTPQEGDGADAVLSRMEDSVRKGQIDAALAEIEKLPASAQDAMADWLSVAQTRNAATAAADELMTALSTN